MAFATTGPFQLVEDEVKRNRAAVTRNLVPGDLVLSSSSLSTVVLPDEKGGRCDQCLSTIGKLMRCSGCASYWYCSSTCQNRSWKAHHKKLCQHISTYKDNLSPSDYRDVLLVGQLVAEHLSTKTAITKAQSQATLQEMVALPLKALMSLMSSPRVSRPSLLGSTAPEDVVSHLFGSIENNHFTATNSYLQPIADAIFPVASRAFNHSCLPNAFTSYRYDSGQLVMDIRTIAEVQEGEEITISYVDPAASCKSRVEALQRSYGFQCKCARCLLQAERKFPSPVGLQRQLKLSLNSFQSDFRSFVFPGIYQGNVSMPDHLSLPVTLETLDSLPTQYHLALNEDYLPYLSRRFHDRAHDASDTSSIDLGVTLLAVYFMVYPKHHALIGVTSLDVAKSIWNIYLQAEISPKKGKGKEYTDLVASLLSVAKQVLGTSMPTSINDKTDHFKEINTLEGLREDEIRLDIYGNGPAR